MRKKKKKKKKKKCSKITWILVKYKYMMYFSRDATKLRLIHIFDT